MPMLLLLLALSASPAKKAVPTRVTDDQGCDKGFDADNELDGEIVCKFPNGSKRYEGMYAHGKRVGAAKTWRDDGKPAGVEHFVDGKREGVVEEYSRHGVIESKCEYKAEQKDGLCQRFDNEGRLLGERRYVKGEQRGAYVDFHSKTGKPHEKGSYDEAGRLDGPREYFREDGAPESLVTMSHGKRDGLEREWFANGQLRREGTWQADHRQGIEKRWYENGQLAESTCYQNDKSMPGLNPCLGKTGREVVTRFGQDGKPRETTELVDGKRQGENRRFDADGQLQQVTVYKDDLADGVTKRFKAGVLIETTTFVAGKATGTQTKFFDDGKTAELNELQQGRQVSHTTWWMNGKKKLTEVADGQWLQRSTWFDTGQQASESRVRVDAEWQKDGRERAWNESGTLVEDREWKNSALDGVQKSFFEKTGKPYREEEWKAGVRLSMKEWDEAGAQVKDERYNSDGSRK